MKLDADTVKMLMGYAVDVAAAILLLIAAWVVAAWLKRIVRRTIEKRGVDTSLAGFLGDLAKYMVLTLAVLTALSVFGVNTTSFAAVLGAAGFAIGLAFQGSLSNFAAGVMLLVFRPFKTGDVVNAAGQTGKVEGIQLFVTQLVTPDNRRLIVPNSAVFSGTIENVTAFDTRRVDVDVGTDYGADLKATRAALEKAIAAASPKLAEPAPQVVLGGLGASSVDWTVRVWTNTPDFFALKESLLAEVKNHLDAANIGIPFPQMDVHVDGTVKNA